MKRKGKASETAKRRDDDFIHASAVETVLLSKETNDGKVWELWNLSRTHRFFELIEYSEEWQARWKREHPGQLLKFGNGRYASTPFDESKAALNQKLFPVFMSGSAEIESVVREFCIAFAAKELLTVRSKLTQWRTANPNWREWTEEKPGVFTSPNTTAALGFGVQFPMPPESMQTAQFLQGLGEAMTHPERVVSVNPVLRFLIENWGREHIETLTQPQITRLVQSRLSIAIKGAALKKLIQRAGLPTRSTPGPPKQG